MPVSLVSGFIEHQSYYTVFDIVSKDLLNLFWRVSKIYAWVCNFLVDILIQKSYIIDIFSGFGSFFTYCINKLMFRNNIFIYICI